MGRASACRETGETDAQEERKREAKVRHWENKRQQPVMHADAAGRNLSPVLFLLSSVPVCSCLGKHTRSCI